MYRAHIQHDRIKPAVVTHTAWKEDDMSVWHDVVLAMGWYHMDPTEDNRRVTFAHQGKTHGTVTIEHREDAG